MRPVRITATIDAPRERVFDYLADLANHLDFSDHYLKEFRLERLQSRGQGASISFRLGRRSAWGEVVIAELERPYRIVLEGQTGRLGRIPVEAVYTLTPHGHEMTKLEYVVSTAPANRIDALKEALGGRLWLRWQSRKAVRRLAAILEEGVPLAHPARVAAG